MLPLPLYLCPSFSSTSIASASLTVLRSSQLPTSSRHLFCSLPRFSVSALAFSIPRAALFLRTIVTTPTAASTQASVGKLPFKRIHVSLSWSLPTRLPPAVPGCTLRLTDSALNNGAMLPGNLMSDFYLGTSTLDNLTHASAAHCGPGTTLSDRIVIGWNGTVSSYFCALAGFSLLGQLMLLAIRESPLIDDTREASAAASSDDVAKRPSISVWASSRHTLSLLLHRRMRGLRVLFLFAGL